MKKRLSEKVVFQVFNELAIIRELNSGKQKNSLIESCFFRYPQFRHISFLAYNNSKKSQQESKTAESENSEIKA